jgi:hypothetical protein
MNFSLAVRLIRFHTPKLLPLHLFFLLPSCHHHQSSYPHNFIIIISALLFANELKPKPLPPQASKLTQTSLSLWGILLFSYFRCISFRIYHFYLSKKSIQLTQVYIVSLINYLLFHFSPILLYFVIFELSFFSKLNQQPSISYNHTLIAKLFL